MGEAETAWKRKRIDGNQWKAMLSHGDTTNKVTWPDKLTKMHANGDWSNMHNSTKIFNFKATKMIIYRYYTRTMAPPSECPDKTTGSVALPSRFHSSTAIALARSTNAAYCDALMGSSSTG